MTEAQLAETLSITRSAVGYHLKQLVKAGFIYVIRREEEKHGIMQKYYSPIAALIVADLKKMPKTCLRYFVQKQIEFLWGVFTSLKLHNTLMEISPDMLELLAEDLLNQILKICIQYSNQEIAENPMNLKIRIFAEALRNLTRQDKWHSLFTKSL